MVSLCPISLKEWQSRKLERLRYEYFLTKDDVVVDLGSYVGEFKNKIIEMYGCKVLEFDPLVNYAAWIEDGYITTGGAYYYTSMFEGNQNCYQCVDIAKKLEPLSEIALLKVNIEGAEYAVLEHIIESGLIGRIKNIQVQFHIVDELPYEDLYYEIAHQLTKTHKLTWQYKYCWENWERI